MNKISVDSDVQDVEVLLDNVAEGVRQWEGGEAPPLDLSLMLGDAGRVSQRASRLKSQWNINSWSIIQSTRPRIGPWIIRFQHFVRKITWWYPEPIIQQIRAFQMNSALTADALAQNQEQILSHSAAQAAEIAELKERVAALEARLETEKADE